MKKLLVTLAFATSAMFASAQIQTIETNEVKTVGRLKTGGILRCELTYVADGTDTTYMLSFIDSRYRVLKELRHISFNGADNTLNTFYSILKSFFTDNNKKNKDYTQQFKLGKDLITVKGSKSFGVYGANIYYDGSYFGMTEKDIDKVFGK